LSARPYFHRYTEDAVDLCDVLSSFSSQGKATLHELCRVMGLPGKPDGISGAEVEKYYRDGHIREIAEYCESDVVNTYRVWLRYELFRPDHKVGLDPFSLCRMKSLVGVGWAYIFENKTIASKQDSYNALVEAESKIPAAI